MHFEEGNKACCETERFVKTSSITPTFELLWYYLIANVVILDTMSTEKKGPLQSVQVFGRKVSRICY